MKFCDDSNIPKSDHRPASKPLPEDVCTSLHHGEHKVSEFLHDSYCFDLGDKQNTYFFDPDGQRFSVIGMLKVCGLEQQILCISGSHVGNLAGLRSIEASVTILARNQDITMRAAR